MIKNGCFDKRRKLNDLLWLQSSTSDTPRYTYIQVNLNIKHGDIKVVNLLDTSFELA